MRKNIKHISSLSIIRKISRLNTGAGFTLIELLIVMIVFGVLAGGLLFLIDPLTQLQKGRDAERKSDLKKVQAALELFYADNGTYAPFDSGPSGWYKITGINSLLNTDGVEYLDELPQGPNNKDNNCDISPYYGYVYGTNGSEYTIYTNLENENDPDVLGVKPDPVYKPGGGSFVNNGNKSVSWGVISCPGEYNYWVNSP